MVCEPNRSPRSWRRFLRFGVRGLIVLVLVIGAGLGWTVRPAHVQRYAVAAIRKAGGSVSYNSEFSIEKYLPAGQTGALSSLVNLVGIDYFGHVTEACAYNMSAATSDEVMSQVGRLAQVQSLGLSDSAVSDAGLVQLKGMTNLSVLLFDHTQISDAGLVQLKGLTHLRYLYLQGTRVTDAGLVHLKGLTNLYYLGLDGTLVIDAGLAHLKDLTNLRRLVLVGLLGDTPVTDAGARELNQALPRLEIFR